MWCGFTKIFFSLILINFFNLVFRLLNDTGLQPARCDPSLVGRCWLAATAGATGLQSAGPPWSFGLLPTRPRGPGASAARRQGSAEKYFRHSGPST